MPMSEKAKEVVFLVGVYVAMLGGMMAKAIFDHMTSGSDLELRQFVIPLLVSPMVYGLVFKAAKGSDETVLMLIFAFQNGFFWQDIFGQLAPSGNTGGGASG